MSVLQDVARLRSAWDSIHVWDIMSEVADSVRKDKDAFKEFIGKEIKINLFYDISQSEFNSIYGSNIVSTTPPSVKVRLADLLSYTKKDGSGKAAFTLEGIVLPKKQIAATSDDIFQIRWYVDTYQNFYTDFLTALAQTELVENLVEVMVPSDTYGNVNPTNVSSTVFRPSVVEIFGDSQVPTWGASGSQFQYYKDNPDASKRIKYLSTNNSTATAYWLRDNVNNATNTSGNRAYVDTSGNLQTLVVSNATTCVDPFCFCIG